MAIKYDRNENFMTVTANLKISFLTALIEMTSAYIKFS